MIGMNFMNGARITSHTSGTELECSTRVNCHTRSEDLELGTRL